VIVIEHSADVQNTGQDQIIIGRAAVAAAGIAEEGKAPSKHWVLEQADVVKYGRDQWKD
jgi:hypothetical protein